MQLFGLLINVNKCQNSGAVRTLKTNPKQKKKLERSKSDPKQVSHNWFSIDNYEIKCKLLFGLARGGLEIFNFVTNNETDHSHS